MIRVLAKLKNSEHYKWDNVESVREYVENLVDPYLQIQNEEFIFSKLKSEFCFTCGKSLLGQKRVIHPIWPYHKFCSECRNLPRCVVCERRCSNKGYSLLENEEIKPYESQIISESIGNSRLYVCAQCRATGTIERTDQAQNMCDSVTKFLQENKTLNLDFRNNKNLRFYCYPSTIKKNDTFTYVPIELIKLHKLSEDSEMILKPEKPISSTVFTCAKTQRNSTNSRRNSWDTTLIFGKCECLKPTKYNYPKSFISSDQHNQIINNNYLNYSSLLTKSIKKYNGVCRKNQKILVKSIYNTYNKELIKTNFGSNLITNIDIETKKNSVIPKTMADIVYNRDYWEETHQRQHEQKCKQYKEQKKKNYQNEQKFDIPEKKFILQHTILDNSKNSRLVKRILLAEGLVTDVIASTLAHELTHAFLFVKGYTFEEGLCNAVALFYILHKAIQLNQQINLVNIKLKAEEKRKTLLLQYIKENPSVGNLIKENFFEEYIHAVRCTKKRLSYDKDTVESCPLSKKNRNYPTLFWMIDRNKNDEENVKFNPCKLSSYHILRLLKKRLVLRRTICRYRFKRMIVADTDEYGAALLIFPLLYKCGMSYIVELIRN